MCMYFYVFSMARGIRRENLISYQLGEGEEHLRSTRDVTDVNSESYCHICSPSSSVACMIVFYGQ